MGEWQSISTHDPFALVTLWLVILFRVRRRRQSPWWQIGFLLTGVEAALATMRAIAPVPASSIEILAPGHLRGLVSAMASGPGPSSLGTEARCALVPTGSPMGTALVERIGWSDRQGHSASTC